MRYLVTVDLEEREGAATLAAGIYVEAPSKALACTIVREALVGAKLTAWERP